MSHVDSTRSAILQKEGCEGGYCGCCTTQLIKFVSMSSSSLSSRRRTDRLTGQSALAAQGALSTNGIRFVTMKGGFFGGARVQERAILLNPPNKQRVSFNVSLSQQIIWRRLGKPRTMPCSWTIGQRGPLHSVINDSSLNMID